MKPNFFIVGAPKSGTTAMYHYLRGHPDVFMPERKEAHYFGSDIRSPIFVNDLDDYLARFEDARDEQRVGEAAIWYLYSEKAAEEIKAFSPDAKIIAMLRNPVDMIYSYHSQRLYNGNEAIRSFEDALAAENDRREGRRLPEDPHPLHGLMYRQIPRYGEQLERYFKVFGRDNVRVIIFDDFKRDTAGAFRQTLEFLGVDPSYQTEFKVINPNRTVRSSFLRSFIYHPPAWTHRLATWLVPKPLRKRILKGLLNFNTKPVKRKSMDPALRARLNDVYREDVEHLGRLLNRDLVTEWKMAEPVVHPAAQPRPA